MNSDYYIEYIEIIELLSDRFCELALLYNPEAFQIESCNLEKCVRNILWQMLSMGGERENYNTCRKNGDTKQDACQRLWESFFERLLPNKSAKSIIADVEKTEIEPCEELAMIQHRLVFYCLNCRLFRYLLPLLNKIPEPVVVLTNQELPDELEVENDIYAFSLTSFRGRGIGKDHYLQKIFPNISSRMDVLFTITEILKPKSYILIEGPHMESLILEAIGKKKAVPTICLQQGWPGIMHSAFRNLRYDYYLTWGKEFSALWKKYNPLPQFVDVGYLYELRSTREKEYITFFLQAPVILLDREYFKCFLDFIVWCAQNYPHQKIYIREHPEYLLPEEYWQKFDRFLNVFRATSLQLADVFSRSKLSIAAFSSTIMEGVIHDVVPFVLDLSSNPSYYPDIHEQQIGIFVNTLEDAKCQMNELLEDDCKLDIFRWHIIQAKNQYFTAYGENTIRNINMFLTQLQLL